MSREQQELALKLWKQKKAEFERQIAITNSPDLKFELRQNIQECEQEIQRLENKKGYLPIEAPEIPSQEAQMLEQENQRLEVFFSYSHKDEELRDELANHLKLLQREGVISSWYDRDISAGSEWEGEIDAHLNSAQIILLLISSDFLASDYCFDVEMTRAMGRHEAGEAVVIPVILRPVDWKSSKFSKLQALPKNAKPLTTWENRDEAFLDIAKGIRKAIASITITVNKARDSELVVSSSQEVERHKNMSTMRSSSEQRKVERLQKDIDFAQRESDNLTRKIEVILKRLENVIDVVEEDSLKQRKLEFEQKRNLVEEKIEKLYIKIEQIV